MMVWRKFKNSRTFSEIMTAALRNNYIALFVSSIRKIEKKIKMAFPSAILSSKLLKKVNI